MGVFTLFTVDGDLPLRAREIWIGSLVRWVIGLE